MDWCWYSCCAYGDWCHPDSSEFTDSEAIRKNVSETERHILGETSQWDGNTDSAVIPYWLVWKGAEWDIYFVPFYNGKDGNSAFVRSGNLCSYFYQYPPIARITGNHQLYRTKERYLFDPFGASSFYSGSGYFILYWVAVSMSKTIIIIGAGLAGLSAALQAAENGCNVKLVSSLPSERAQSVMAEGGINAALNTKDENDSPEEHFTDTIKAACGLADPNAVWGMTQAAPELVHWLLKLGVQFNMSGYDDVDLRNFGGQKKKRTAFAQSDTGKQIMTAMIDAVRRKEASGMVERFSHHSFLTLRLCDNICCGCVIRDEYSQETVELPGDAVIVATGGMHGLFGNTTGSLSNTGEVTAELFRLGVPLANGEMIQYHPTTVKCGGKRMLISEAARGEGGRLFAMKDGKQWYFMEEKYPELGNLMPRDITAREIWKVSHESEVFLDMTEISEEIISNKLSGLADDCMTYLHKDIRKEPVSVLPGIHYFMGGILVDEQHRTPIQNLYAAGECCAQYHGANRLGGNSLLGALYGGRVAAKSACEQADVVDLSCATQIDFPPTSQISEIKQLNKVMQETMGVVRNENTLLNGIQTVQALTGNLPLLGMAVLKSALARKESRGAHWREDYPKSNDDDYLKTTVARFDGKQIQISFVPVPERR